MHELAIAESIVSMADETALGRRVRTVTVEIGAQSCVSPEALMFCFWLAAEGTAAEGATLEIVQTKGDGLILKNMRVEEAA